MTNSIAGDDRSGRRELDHGFSGPRPGEMPKKFLDNVQGLMRCGLIKSQRGACGGYTLARSPEQISFYDDIEAIEGPIAVKRTNRNGGRP
jgi:DNA-binding IscR family transcriptional regulator